jgi:subtilisin family serine protease
MPPVIVLPERRFLAMIRLYSEPKAITAQGIVPTAFAGPLIEHWTELRRIGAYITESTRQLELLAQTGLVSLLPVDLRLAVSKDSAIQPQEKLSPWHRNHIGHDSDSLQTAGRNIRVGIIDTGANGLNSELVGQIDGWATCKTTGTPDPGVGPCRDTDAQGQHGTFVASLVAGKTLGIAPQARLFVAAVNVSKGTVTLGELFNAIKWLREDHQGRRRADVINISLQCGLCSGDLRTLLDQTVADLIVTIAVGNKSCVDETSLLARSSGVVAVGAHDKEGDWGSTGYGFHHLDRVDPLLPPTYNPIPHIHAPGVEVPVNAEGTLTGEGSSFASAIVAGAAAVLYSRESALLNPGNGPTARERLLQKTVCLNFTQMREVPGARMPWLR